MHPSFSVIFFTTSSGAGYGLLFLLGLLAPAGLVPTTPLFGFVSLALALGGITAGLLSSTFHLSHPRRAVHAFSQWRSSWLSREAVASVATYVPAAILGILWVFFGTVSPPAGVASALGAVVTVACTAMIYRSLKPIQRWHNGWVLPNYFALALMNGSLWLSALLGAFGSLPSWSVWLALLTTAFALVLKFGYWRFIDRTASPSTPESATGLGRFGAVRQLEAPHTSENYLLKEMGFQIARRHAARLRRIAIAVGFVAPLLLTMLLLLVGGAVAAIVALLAAALGTFGTLVERWLFFAEARHAVTLYYGRPAA